LPLDPRFAGLNQADEDGFLMVIKICCTTSFIGEVKPKIPCCKILRPVKELCRYKKDTL
jgi:hypothetical protein